MESNELKKIVSQFDIKGTVNEIKPLGDGLINDTFKVVTAESDQPNYVLQHINNAIFENVEMLMDNIIAVTTHIRRKLEAAGTNDIDRKVLTFVSLTSNGKFYYVHTDGSYWRIMLFIPDAVTKTGVTPESSYEVGETFGNFHNMEFRLQQLRDAVKEDKAGRVAEVKDLLEEIERRADEMCKGERLHREGKLPKRICHCDTKVDNMMFDQDGNVLCVIDLDTVMPNFVFSDFGDFLRSAANTGKEDDKDLDAVNFNMEIFKSFAKGYLKSARSFLTPVAWLTT